MKKNFLKKLAFTMAFATAFTALSPAAGVFAAAKPSLTVGKTLTLLLGTDRAENDINVKNKVKGSKYAWSTSNKAVATVDKNGVVVAKKTGTAKVTLKITLPTKKTQTLTTTVNVKDNIKEVAINNAPEKAIKVGDEYDFNRTIVSTFGGNKKAHKGAVTRWEIVSENKEKATINDAGVFVAEEAGEYEIVAISFQSKAKYADYLKGKDTVTAKSESVKVKVENTITSFKAVKSNTLEVTFASAIEKADLANYVLVDTKTSQKVYAKNATLSADKKVVSLELYNPLTNDVTYELTATIDKVVMKAEFKFIRGSVAKIEAVDQLVKVTNPLTAQPIAYTVYDENGLDITADTFVTFESTIFVSNDGTITLVDGQIAYVTVVFTNVNTGAQVKSQQFKVTGSKDIANVLHGYTVVDNTWDVNFDDPKTTVAMGSNKTLYVQIINQFGQKGTAINGTDVTFETLDPRVVVVDSQTGRITPVSVGTGNIKIISAGTTVNRIVPITVQAASYAANIDAPTTAKGSLTGNGLNNPTVSIPVRDQYGNHMANSDLVFELVSGANVLSDFTTVGQRVTYNRTLYSSDYTFTANAVGTAYLKVSQGGLQPKHIAITITGNDSVEVGYVLDGVKKLDINAAYRGWGADEAIANLQVYAVNKNNEKIVAISGADVSITVIDPYNNATTVTGGSFALNVQSGRINHTAGTYRVIASKLNASFFNGTFEVVDTAGAPVVKLSRNTISSATVSESVLAGYLNLPNNASLVDIAYHSSNAAKIAPRNIGDAKTIQGLTGSVTLYNIRVSITLNGRPYVVNVADSLTITN